MIKVVSNFPNRFFTSRASVFLVVWMFACVTRLAASSEPSPATLGTHSEPAVATPSAASDGATPALQENAKTPSVVTTKGSNGQRELPKESLKGQEWIDYLKSRLEQARHLRHLHAPDEASPILVELLEDESPDDIHQEALLELSMVAQEENDLPRAQSVLAQFISLWPHDSRIPEILLRQGQLFRQMGLSHLALAKFYSVMTAALSLKSDQLTYYQKLVLQAQMEIAESHYQMGEYAEAADFYSRLLKQNDPALNRPQTQYRLIRSLAAIGKYDEAASQGEDFLSRFSDAPEQAEVRFYFAQALKHLGRNGESLQQVLLLLQEQKIKTRDRPTVWGYWQQRAGNEIANQLYREGDYPKALEIYVNLSQLDSAPTWQIPVSYQIGMTYERLLQPQKAIETYNTILGHEAELGTNASPGLKAIFDMARWRADFLKWQDKAEAANRKLAADAPRPSAGAGSPSTPSVQ